MRIISKFHDYYDSCMKYGVDMKCIYKRETTEFSAKKDFPAPVEMRSSLFWKKPAEYSFWEHSYRHGMVWFCGKPYPYIELEGVSAPMKGSSLYKERELIYCYNEKEAVNTILAYGSKEEKARIDLRKRSRFGKALTNRELITQFFLRNRYADGEIIEVLCKLGVPVLHLEPSHPKLILNPILKNLQFFKVFAPFTAYQELSMFISGVMGGQAPPMVPVSDEVRLEKHGFDKWSFRKKVR